MEHFDRLMKKSLAKKEIDLICDYVIWKRKLLGISEENLSFEPLWEGSCLAFGEGYNLLYRQLIPVAEESGDWEVLKDSEVRSLVIDEIHKDGNYFKKRNQ